ncbi:hypothetical protein [endosymbiont GvMRE of Glomus versiforme]|uniref:hypothetical protein n=1 Tax=endosymbiont GvMRE of Glomus versiforme TaxID=2039283 RepID=UPI000EDE8932|nr:hypothetical protein [endosymbiont GvMRE of Glomus versiforme]RHZ36169.1 hypothetical protein GvMRE_Ic2g72 [endosymbiont GvMRE of Glomus versiforme]
MWNDCHNNQTFFTLKRNKKRPSDFTNRRKKEYYSAIETELFKEEREREREREREHNQFHLNQLNPKN